MPKENKLTSVQQSIMIRFHEYKSLGNSLSAQMAKRRKPTDKAEFGDFQTPRELAAQVCKLLRERGESPVSLIEPTCGSGSFLVAALDQFPSVQEALGLDINPRYVALAKSAVSTGGHAEKTRVLRRDFFHADWPNLLRTLGEPILVIGNPPWVTNAELGALGGSNLPEKTNFQNHSGLDAVTGKSNFDISEWMLIRLLDWLDGCHATLAMLCKTAVARKVLLHAWKRQLLLKSSEIRLIDTRRHFGVAVDACLLICELAPSSQACDAPVYSNLRDAGPSGSIGFREGRLIANADAYERWKHLRGGGAYRWRSGIKHDCSKVMEFRREGTRYRNGLGDLVALEDDYVYPMLKGSDLAKHCNPKPKRWMLVTQRSVTEQTSSIRTSAPRTWRYLLSHADWLDKRASSIYRRRPRFSIFGVGEYSFSTWKVAVPALYKKLAFTKIGCFGGKPVVLDDTSIFLACETKRQADSIASLLSSDVSREFLSAFIFWDAKRPITVDVLQQLDLFSLARELGVERRFPRQTRQKQLFD